MSTGTGVPVVPVTRGRSGTDNAAQGRYLVILVVVVVAAVLAGRSIWNHDGAAEAKARAALPPVGASPVVLVVTATAVPTAQPTYTPYPTYTPWVVQRAPDVIVVTATPLPTVPPTATARVVYRQVSCPTALPVVACAAAPTPLPPVGVGLMRVCIDVEGVSGVYVDGVGVTGHSCSYVTSVGMHQVEVTR